MLLNWPTGISWQTIPTFTATQDQQLAVAATLASAATSAVDRYLETTARATINTETLYGPGQSERFTIQRNGVARAILSCPPILFAVGGSVQATTLIGSGVLASPIAAANIVPEVPLRGVYGTNVPSSAGEIGQTVLITGGMVNWWNGRGGTQLTVQYANGWPHASLTAGVTAGQNVVQVDDITAWWNPITDQGACGTIYDFDASLQEVATVTAVTPNTPGAISGPGTLTLSSNVINSHSEGTIFTSLPGTIITATIQFAVHYALMRGATATTMPTLQGAGGMAGGSATMTSTKMAAEGLIHAYKRAR